MSQPFEILRPEMSACKKDFLLFVYRCVEFNYKILIAEFLYLSLVEVYLSLAEVL